MPDLLIENTIDGVVAGVDEAGRGPWAGPVVAAAVVLDKNNIPDGINDSKKISQKKRELLYEKILATSLVGVGIASVEDIDRLNILQASMYAMQKAVGQLNRLPDMALIDGNKIPQLSCNARYVIKGDSISLSIAAASIIAKVTRDRIMSELDGFHPHYLWAKNSGYGTKAHIEAIEKHGITEHHRKSFKPIAKIIAA